jgi:hypothetical protein
MIDVFLRWYPQNELRRHMAMAVLARLGQMHDIHITNIIGGTIAEPYHTISKKMAEALARTPIYCVMDDDQLPLRDDFFSLGESILASHPNFGMLSGFPLEYGLVGQPYSGALAADSLIVEAHSIGCPYFVRKGTLTHFPDSPLHMYDGDLSKVVTDQGLKTGLIPKALYNHLGYGFSQVEHATVARS